MHRLSSFIILLSLIQVINLSAQDRISTDPNGSVSAWGVEFLGGRSVSLPIIPGYNQMETINKPGNAFRVAVSHTIKENITLVGSFALEQKGYKAKVTDPSLNMITLTDETSNYVTLSPLVRYKLWRISSSVGPYLGYIATSSQDTRITENGRLVFQSKRNTTTSEYRSRTDAGLVGQIGTEINLSTKVDLICYGQYAVGLTNVSKPVNSKFYNSTFSIFLGITLKNLRR
jgi:hypothetical protein